MAAQQEQTKKQFELMYGDKTKWSKTTKACYDHLFGGLDRITAATNNNVTEQSIYAFIKNNKFKHLSHPSELARLIAYRDAALVGVNNES